MLLYCRACVFSTKRTQGSMLSYLKSIRYYTWPPTFRALGRKDTSAAADEHRDNIWPLNPKAE
ncbi:MAG: hypothetical protein WCR52_16045, partial [Bacteroidota bacterium]